MSKVEQQEEKQASSSLKKNCCFDAKANVPPDVATG